MTRDQKIAHLEIHGWQPIQDGSADPRRYHGIWSDSEGIGFAYSRSAAGGRAIQLDPPFNNWEPDACSWNAILDFELDAILARMSET